ARYSARSIGARLVAQCDEAQYLLIFFRNQDDRLAFGLQAFDLAAQRLRDQTAFRGMARRADRDETRTGQTGGYRLARDRLGSAIDFRKRQPALLGGGKDRETDRMA